MGAVETEFLQEAELSAFLDRHGDEVYSYLCALCRDDERAAESLQNAYLKFLEMVRRGKVRRESAPQYLQTIARNDFYDQMRREKRESPLLDEPVDDRASTGLAGEDLARQLQLAVLETLAKPSLPADVALVMRLRFVEGEEIASICLQSGRSQATVYRLMEKALTALAETCRQHGLHPGEIGL